VLVSESPQSSVMVLAAFLMHNAGPTPVIQRGPEPLVAAVAHDDLGGLAASPCDGRGASVRSQRLIIPLSQGIERFCDQNGGDGPPDAWNREQDGNIAAQRAAGLVIQFGDVFEPSIHALGELSALLIRNAQPWQHEQHAFANRFRNAGGDWKRSPPQNFSNLLCCDPPDAMLR